MPCLQVGFPKRDPQKLSEALIHTHTILWIRSNRRSRWAKLGQLLGFARATSDGALSATIWDVAVSRDMGSTLACPQHAVQALPADQPVPCTCVRATGNSTLLATLWHAARSPYMGPLPATPKLSSALPVLLAGVTQITIHGDAQVLTTSCNLDETKFRKVLCKVTPRLGMCCAG